MSWVAYEDLAAGSAKRNSWHGEDLMALWGGQSGFRRSCAAERPCSAWRRTRSCPASRRGSGAKHAAPDVATKSLSLSIRQQACFAPCARLTSWLSAGAPSR